MILFAYGAFASHTASVTARHSACLKVVTRWYLEEPRGRKGSLHRGLSLGDLQSPPVPVGMETKAFQPRLSPTVAEILSLNLHWISTCI